MFLSVTTNNSSVILYKFYTTQPTNKGKTESVNFWKEWIVQHRYVVSREWMTVNNEFKIMWKEVVGFWFAYYYGIYLKGLRKLQNTSVRIVCVLNEVKTGCLQNKNQNCYIFKQLVWPKVGVSTTKLHGFINQKTIIWTYTTMKS
jgi:hypothetical protein